MGWRGLYRRPRDTSAMVSMEVGVSSQRAMIEQRSALGGLDTNQLSGIRHQEVTILQEDAVVLGAREVGDASLLVLGFWRNQTALILHVQHDALIYRARAPGHRQDPVDDRPAAVFLGGVGKGLSGNSATERHLGHIRQRVAM